MKKQWLWIAGSAAVILAVALIGVTVWAFQLKDELEFSQEQASIRENEAFYKLSDELQSLEIRLSKLEVTETPGSSARLLLEVSSQAAMAAEALAQLSLEEETGTAAVAFLNRISDYTASLLVKVSEGSPLSNDNMALLRQIQDACVGLRNAVDTMDFSAATQMMLAPAFPEEMSQKDTVYPVMIYDGPFSEDIVTEPPKGLTGEEGTEESALAKAAEFFQCAPEEVSAEGYQMGIWNGWIFAHEDARIMLSKQGLHLIWLLKETNVSQILLTQEEGCQLALEAAQAQGMEEMTITWTQEYDGALVVCMAPLLKGAILYPDLVKVKVNLEDGSLLAFDATHYYSSHIQREIPDPIVTGEEATSLVSSSVEVQEVRLAWISLDTGDEYLTWEVRGTASGDQFYLYIDALDGTERVVYRVVETRDGDSVLERAGSTFSKAC